MAHENTVSLNETMDALEELAVAKHGDAVATNNTATFEDWMEALDGLAMEQFGLNAADLPTLEYEALYQRGVTPQQCLDEAIASLLRNERLRRRLEVEMLFEQSHELGRNLTAPHILEEAGLDFVAALPEDEREPLEAAYEWARLDEAA
jgi:hypothetical protein